MDFVLREWKIQDVTAVAEYADNPGIADHLRDAFPYPYTQEDARQYVESCITVSYTHLYKRLKKQIQVFRLKVINIPVLKSSVSQSFIPARKR